MLKKCPKKFPNVRTKLGLLGQNVRSKFQSSWNPVYPVNLMMKMCQVVIRQREGYTQHKPEVVDYCEPFHDFSHQIMKVYAPKRMFWRNYNYRCLIVKILLTLGLHAVFIEFCKIYGYFCKVFAAYKQVSDSTAFFIKSLVFCFCCLPQ